MVILMLQFLHKAVPFLRSYTQASCNRPWSSVAWPYHTS